MSSIESFDPNNEADIEELRAEVLATGDKALLSALWKTSFRSGRLSRLKTLG